MYSRWFVVNKEEYEGISPNAFEHALYRDTESVIFMENECPSAIKNCCIATELTREEFCELEHTAPIHSRPH